MATKGKNPGIPAQMSELEQLRAENEALKAAAQAKIKDLEVKISERSGAVMVRNLNGRFPLTLYKDQWRRLIEFIPEVEAFIEEHDEELSENREDSDGRKAAYDKIHGPYNPDKGKK